MILSLSICNVALIEQLTIPFRKGLNVLSGETGAGKSIVVDAVNLALGGRADKDLIRTGTNRATVEAEFDVGDNPQVAAVLARENVEYDPHGLTVYREINLNGKNICRICGVLLPLSVLKEISSGLMDVHGQHEHQFLMNPERHMAFLDQTGSEEEQQLLKQVAEDCAAFLQNHRQYGKLIRENNQKKQRLEELESNLKKLHAARLKPGEEERLQEEYKRLMASENISSTLRTAYEDLSLGEEEPACLEKLSDVSQCLNSLRDYGKDIAGLADRCQNLYYELQEVAYELRGLLDKCESDPQRLEKLEARLNLIQRLERKYGPYLDDVLEAQKEQEKEFAYLSGLDDTLDEMSKEHKRLLSVYRKSARLLTEQRKRQAEAFDQRMMGELHDLGMPHAVFQSVFKPNISGKPLMPKASGDDELEFMISPNPGEPLKPLAKIASGGELSRIMLAIKALEADHSGVDAMVFDEIDTGISGRMAQTVAEKMIVISRKRQVLCVTHLPQLAAAADWEYLVHKGVQEGRTYTSVDCLDRAGRIGEVARMISGAEGATQEACAYAEKMIAAGEKLKAQGDS